MKNYVADLFSKRGLHSLIKWCPVHINISGSFLFNHFHIFLTFAVGICSSKHVHELDSTHYFNATKDQNSSSWTEK